MIGLDEKYGQMSRQRTCIEGLNGGQTCQDVLGPNVTTNIQTEFKNCAGHDFDSPKICPLDISWTLWTPWTICSANCGHSIKRKTRSCVDGKYGGPKCVQNYEEITQKCPTKVYFYKF